MLPDKIFDLKLGDAEYIRNAGGTSTGPLQRLLSCQTQCCALVPLVLGSLQAVNSIILGCSPSGCLRHVVL